MRYLFSAGVCRALGGLKGHHPDKSPPNWGGNLALQAMRSERRPRRLKSAAQKRPPEPSTKAPPPQNTQADAHIGHNLPPNPPNPPNPRTPEPPANTPQPTPPNQHP
ncbi:hypothetical protein GCM10025785_22620 [Corynebacterium canis]